MYQGDIAPSSTLDFKFNTCQTDGTPITLGGSAAIAVYKGNGTSPGTTGLSLTVDFNSQTGMHHVRVVTTDSWYEEGYDYEVVLSAGTVGGTSVVGTVVGSFSINNRASRGILSSSEIAQLRQALGITGTKTVTSGGNLDTVQAKTDKLNFDGSNYVKSVEQVKTGFILAATGLDSITNTEPVKADSDMNFREGLVRLIRRFVFKHTLTSTELTQFANDDTTPTVKQTVSEAAGTQTVGGTVTV